MTRLTIGQLAKRAGVSTSLLRYYEEQGLLEPAAAARRAIASMSLPMKTR